MSAKTPLSGDELRNTLHLDILHDTNVSDRHIEKLVELIEQEVTKRVEAAYELGHAHERDYSISPNSDERDQRHERELEALFSLKAGDAD